MKNAEGSNRGGRYARFKGMGGVGTIGLEIVLSILFGLFIGYKLDGWLGTSPWMSVLWFGFGCAAAGRAVYRGWKDMQRAAKQEEEEEGNPPQEFPDEKSLAWKREDDKRAEEEEKRARGNEGASPPAEENADASEPTLEKGADSATKEREQ